MKDPPPAWAEGLRFWQGGSKKNIAHTGYPSILLPLLQLARGRGCLQKPSCPAEWAPLTLHPCFRKQCTIIDLRYEKHFFQTSHSKSWVATENTVLVSTPKTTFPFCLLFLLKWEIFCMVRLFFFFPQPSSSTSNSGRSHDMRDTSEDFSEVGGCMRPCLYYHCEGHFQCLPTKTL